MYRSLETRRPKLKHHLPNFGTSVAAKIRWGRSKKHFKKTNELESMHRSLKTYRPKLLHHLANFGTSIAGKIRGGKKQKRLT